MKYTLLTHAMTVKAIELALQEKSAAYQTISMRDIQRQNLNYKKASHCFYVLTDEEPENIAKSIADDYWTPKLFRLNKSEIDDDSAFRIGTENAAFAIVA